MSAPIYFLPKVMLAGLAPQGKLSRSVLSSRGLGPALADVEDLCDLAYCEICGKGPNGEPGICLSALPNSNREPPRRMGYFAADQLWTRLDEGLWIATDPAFPPTPADLERRLRFAGYKIKLGDGNEWEVPVLRDFSTRQPRLPRDMFFDANGAFTLRLRDEYQKLWEQSERVARLFFEPASEDFGKIPLADALTIAVEALALNYRLGQAEQRVLRLVTSDNWQDVLGAIVDWPAVEKFLREDAEASKKNAVPASACTSSPSMPGAADCCPDTAPAAAS